MIFPCENPPFSLVMWILKSLHKDKQLIKADSTAPGGVIAQAADQCIAGKIIGGDVRRIGTTALAGTTL